MNTEQLIADIERLEHLFRLSDPRQFQITHWKEEKLAVDEENLHNPLALPRLPRLEWLEGLFGLIDNRPLMGAKGSEES